MRMQHLVSSPLSDTVVQYMCKNGDATRRAISIDLFGLSSVTEELIDISAARFPRKHLNSLTERKIKSIGKKYDIIPGLARSYYSHTAVSASEMMVGRRVEEAPENKNNTDISGPKERA